MDINKIILPHISDDGNKYLPTPLIKCVQDFVNNCEQQLGLSTTNLISSFKLAVEAQQVRRTVGNWVVGIQRYISKFCVDVLGLLVQDDGQ
jgi:hypothetical protein